MLPKRELVKFLVSYSEHHKLSITNPDAFWTPIANELYWHKKWDKVLDASNPPFYRWFVGGETNLCYNCVDRWAALPSHANRKALIYENPMENKSIPLTYTELLKEVNAVAGMLQELGLKKGDRVIIYLPMSLEAVIATLACVRIGLIHSIIFAGFSKEAIAVRIDDSQPQLIITSDGSSRAGKVTLLKSMIDDAVNIAQFKVPKIIVKNYKLTPYTPVANRDYDWDDLLAKCPIKKVDPVWLKSTDPSYVLYTSGTTGKPKGALRDTGGYMVAVYYSMFSLYGCTKDSVYFSTSDIGWVVGHSYIIYGPLLGGLTSIVYDGTPINPDPSVWFSVMAKHKVDVVFSSPTAFRMLRKYDTKYIKSQDLSALRYLFLAGEPLDPATYEWVKEALGPGKFVVDNYWQTETGWPILCNPVGVEQLPIKAGSPTKAAWGWNLEVVDEKGTPLPANTKGYLIAHGPTPPGVMLTVYGDDERYVSSYWRNIPGKDVYFTGDYAIVDSDGYFFVLGRADEVIKVASHRLGTRELEELVNTHPKVAENSTIGIADSLKGQVPIVLLVLKAGITPSDEIKNEIRDLIRNGIGPIATPKDIIFVDRLPKTRSGKVMRRVIKALAEGQALGDLSTIEDGASVEEIRGAIEQLKKIL
jgi:propionyl-CoA synthetase